jgi:hypothetical protein
MLRQTLRTKVHLCEPPTMMRQSYQGIYGVFPAYNLLQAPRICRSQIRTFRSSTRKLPLTALIAKTLTTLGLNTDEFSDLVTTKINQVEVNVDSLKEDVSTLKIDVSSLKGDVSTLKTDIKDLGTKLEYSMKEQLSQYALSQEKQFSQYALNQERQFSQFYFRSLFGVSLTPYIKYQFLMRLRSWVLQYC